MKRIVTLLSAVALAVLCIAGCQSSGSSYEAAEYIPGNTPMVMVTNPEQILSQSKLAENTAILNALEIPEGMLDNLGEYGIDPKENIYLFMISQHSFGLVTKLQDNGKFLTSLAENTDLKIEDGSWFDGECGFKIYKNVLVGLYEEDAADARLEEYIEELHQEKGENSIIDNKIFKEMVAEPSVLGVWFNPYKTRTLLKSMAKDTKAADMLPLMDMSARMIRKDGSMYYNFISADGGMKLVSAGDWLSDEFSGKLSEYSGDHLEYIPEDAGLVIGCNFDGNYVSTMLRESEMANQLNMVSALGVDVWGLLRAMQGDFTLSLNELSLGKTAEGSQANASITMIFDLNDKECVSQILKDMSSALAPMMETRAENTYLFDLGKIGELNLGLEDDMLYMNLSTNKGFEFTECNRSYVGKPCRNSFAYMGMESSDWDGRTLAMLGPEVNRYLNVFDSMFLNAELDGNIVRQNLEINFKDGINPMEFLLDIVAEHL